MSMLWTRSLAPLLLTLVIVGCARHAPASPPSLVGGRIDRAAFIARLGVDTIFIEQFSRTGREVNGVMVNRSPTTTVTRFAFTSDTAFRITRLTAVTHAAGAPPGSRPLWSIDAKRQGDGLEVALREAESERRRFIPNSADALLIFDRSVAVYELATQRLRASGADSLDVPVIEFDSLSLGDRRIERLGTDSVVLRFIFPRGERAAVDSTGRIIGISGLATSYKWLTERVTDLDTDALTASFASRDAKGAAFGNLSARDTVRAVVGDARIAIDYGRPSKRGRVIFGGLVPWDRIWRTGADLATHFTTDRSIRLGGPADGIVIPAGTYTLYTIPAPNGWTLVVNKRTGQSGLDYDQAADLGRVSMRTRSVSEVTERLTISVSGQASSGTLRIAWDTTAADVPFEVLPSPKGAAR